MSKPEGEVRLEALDAVVAALAHPARRQILLTIHFRGGQAAAGEIAARFAHAWPTTTRHLEVLADAGLLEREREGRSVIYRLRRERLLVLEEWLAWFDRPHPAPPKEQSLVTKKASEDRKASVPPAALAKMRGLCRGLADVSEGRHFEKVAFLVKGKMFATCGVEKGRCGVVLALEPWHIAELVDADPRFRPYARAKGAVEVDVAALDDWAILRPLLRESYDLAATPKAGRKRGG